jgi:hypothetical protein
MGLKPAWLAMIARLPNRQSQRKLATQSHGSKAFILIYGSYDCQITEERWIYISSRGRGLAAPSHTTGHAGPHPAVHPDKRSS